MKSFTQYAEEQDRAAGLDMDADMPEMDSLGGPDKPDMMGSNDPKAAIAEIMAICQRVLGEDDMGSDMGGEDDVKNIARPDADGPGNMMGGGGMGPGN